MKYYTSSQYTGKTKQKRILRIALICSLIAGILVGTAVLGNLFKDRLQRAADLLALQPQDYAVVPQQPAGNVYTAPTKKRPMTLNGICAPIQPASFKDKKTLEKALEEAAISHKGISMTVANESGFRFALDATDTAGDALKKSVLTDTVSLASARDLPVSATLYTTGSAKTDSAVMKELSQCGVTEVLLCGLTDDTLDNAYTYTLLLYLEQLRAEAPGMTVGIALSPALFQSAATAVHLDTLFQYFDYLALDLTKADSVLSVEEACDALYGSMSYYDLAVLLDAGTAETVSPDTWTEAGIKNARFLTGIDQ